MVNALDNQDSSSFDEIKAAEDMKLQALKEKLLASHGTSKSSTKSLKHCFTLIIPSSVELQLKTNYHIIYLDSYISIS